MNLGVNIHITYKIVYGVCFIFLLQSFWKHFFINISRHVPISLVAGWSKRTSALTWKTESVQQFTKSSASPARRRNVARSTIRWRRDFLEPRMAILLSYSHLHLILYFFQVMEQQCSVTNEQKCDTTNEEVFFKLMITI